MSRASQVGQDVDAKKKTGEYAPAHILREIEPRKYLVKWDNNSKDADETVSEADIRVPSFQVPDKVNLVLFLFCRLMVSEQPQERVKARWAHDSKWYDAQILEKLKDGRYRINWFPPQPDDRDKNPQDLKRVFGPQRKTECQCTVS